MQWVLARRRVEDEESLDGRKTMSPYSDASLRIRDGGNE